MIRTKYRGGRDREEWNGRGDGPRRTGGRRRNSSVRREDLRDLGFGTRVSNESSERLLNRDGSFNVDKGGLSLPHKLNTYHMLLTMSGWKFYLTLLSGFILINLFFSGLFLLCGPDCLAGLDTMGEMNGMLRAFFFSVETFTTVGYGTISPVTIEANIIATLDAFFGLLSFALATGLVFARFSRPTARILYSDVALVAPYNKVEGVDRGFMFRIANLRKSQLIEVDIVVMFTRLVGEGEDRRREYHSLSLERSHVSFFPLHWTIVHPIDELSPLYNVTEKELLESEGEFLILLTAIDDTFSQTVHSRSSYRVEELVWDARFVDPFDYRPDGSITVDLDRLHMWESADGLEDIRLFLEEEMAG